MALTPMTPWQTSVQALDLADASPDAVSWLVEVGSITARLRTHWPAVTVDVLDEGLLIPTAAELDRLGLACPQACWVRSVRLQADGRGLVHARSVIPNWHPGNPWYRVSRLGQRPLGELLFSLPGLGRSPLEFALTLPPTTPGGHTAGPTPSRRRVHWHGASPLLLTEAFDLLALPTPCPAGA